MSEIKSVKELIQDIENKIIHIEPIVDDNTSNESNENELEKYKVVILKSKNTNSVYIDIKPMKICNALVLNNYISRYRLYCTNKVKKRTDLFYIIAKNDVFVYTLKDNLNLEDAEQEQLKMFVDTTNQCINLMDIRNEPIDYIKKINTIKVDNMGNEKLLYSRTYKTDGENKFNYNAIKCKEYYEKNKSKRADYSKAYYAGLKQLALK
jgi:hypothetical protein